MQSVPFADEMEKGLIAGILSDPAVVPKVTLLVEPKDFYRERNREIFEAILSIDVDNLDSLAVESRLTDSDTKEYFQQLVRDSDAILPGLSNILYYAETIKSKSKLRDGYELGREIAAICYQDNIDASDALERLEAKFSSFLRTRISENSLESTKEAFNQFIERLGVRVHDTSGIKTGFRSIDLVLHKLQGLIILAAKTNVGKTTFVTNIARNVGEHKPVLFFSLEQPRDQIFEKILSLESGVRHEDIATGAFIGSPHDVEKINVAKEKLIDVFDNIHIDDTSNVNSSYIASVARQKYFEKGEIGLIIVDYLHIMRLGERNLTEALGDAVKDLRALGRELKCPVILLSQLSRQPSTTQGFGEDEKRIVRRPELSDLRSSGEIEQSADVVIFMHRDSYYEQSGYISDEDEVEIIIKKNRLGRTGIVTLTWVPPIMKYIDRTYQEIVGGLWSENPITTDA